MLAVVVETVIFAMPPAPVTPEPVMPAGELVMVTGTPTTGVELVSTTVTVTVAGTPTKTEPGATVTVEFAASIAVTSSVAVLVMGTVFAVALMVKLPPGVVVRVTVNVATPLEFENTEAGEMVSPGAVSETGTFGTRLLAVSRTVTVTVAGTLTGTVAGETVTVVSDGLTCRTMSPTVGESVTLPAVAVIV